MIKATRFLLVLMAFFACSSYAVSAQTTGSISGEVRDEKQAIIPKATVAVRNVETNVTRTAQTSDEGRYRFENLPVGGYELIVEMGGFAKHVQSGITLELNQNAIVDITMRPGGVQEVVNVVENASMLNTSTAEVGTRFDPRRLSELPLATNRNVFNVALSASGISQIQSNQSQFAQGIGYSSNGGRLRSNNFMIDGQDNNDTGIAGASVQLNNPDLIQEVRLITNQFNAEYGRNSSSIFNAITKSGTNQFHGSAFWFHNDNALNACSNLNKNAGFCNPNATDPGKRHAPFRIENQLGATFGGPLHLPRVGEGGPSIISGKDRTFFFVSVQRWWDRQLGSGFTLNGAPTEAGRQILQNAAGARPQVQALLQFVPAAQSSTGSSARFSLGGQVFTVPVGNLTGSTAFRLDDWQGSVRVDHRLTAKHNISGRYIFNDNDTKGSGQATPPGNASQNVNRSQGVNLTVTSVISPRFVNEWRGAYLRRASNTGSQDPSSELIPSIEISELGMIGFNAGDSRTGFGLAVNLPQFSFQQTYQLQDNISYTTGNHALKFGVDIRRQQLKQFFFPTIRGRLFYASLDRFVNDVADVATINKPLIGGEAIFYYDWHDFGGYAQDEWKIRPNFTLTYGLRYETPGQPITDLVKVNNRIVAAAGGNEGFRFTPVPKRDKNNFQPRIGFNWNPRTSSEGLMGLLTGGDRLVIRGGYGRSYDYTFTNIAANIASSFPFVASVTLSTVAQAATPVTTNPGPGVNNAFVVLPAIQGATGLNPNTLTRTIVGADLRSPSYDSFSLEVQRELSRDLVLRVGYVGSKGNSLFQTLDGNPRLPFSTTRVDPTRSIIRLRANAASSIYHSMQTSLEKRLSRGFSFGLHYTWSTFIDTASEIFNPSGAEVAVSQDSFNRRADRGRSSYDRPQRLAGNFVYELPYFRSQSGPIGRLLGGWQLNSSFSLQSGAPFTPLNGSDPTGALSGIDGLVGSAIRPNLNTTLPISGMSVEQLVAAGGSSLFRTLCGAPNAAKGCAGERVGNAGRNILRADGINNIDFGILKNTRIGETQKIQIRADFYNATNSRDFGIPEGRVNSTQFLNQWGTNGGNRRVIVGLRYVF
jgi:Carboxypeptidase regulatory-like domain